MDVGILSLDDFDFKNKTVIFRVDINSPVNQETGGLADDNRIRKSAPTMKRLSEAGAKVVMLAHQGDTEDYQNLITLEPHAKRLTELLGQPVEFMDDICGPAAVARIKALKPGELLLLNNVRYLSEEMSTFVNFVKLTPEKLAKTWLVRNLAPLADIFVCEAFAAAHRYSPSLVGFAEVLPSAAGPLFLDEFTALARVKEQPEHPCVFVLGGARIADAFSMMKQVLGEGAADQVLTSGLTGEVMWLAKGAKLGAPTEKLIADKGLLPFVENARELLATFGDRIQIPEDFAYDDGGRVEIGVNDLPVDKLLVDVGAKTVERYIKIVNQAKTIFVNGPTGVYENPVSSWGTETLFTAIADAPGYSVIGGGDSVAAAGRFKLKERMSYVCTSGGGMVRFLSGQELPVVTGLRRATARYRQTGK
jgi:phosphoglycerate kinase